MTIDLPILGAKQHQDGDAFDFDVINFNAAILDGQLGIVGMTTAQRNALTNAQRPPGRTIWNSTTGNHEVNIGTAAAPFWATVPAQVVARKTVDEGVASSIALQNDDELFFSMRANEIWEFNAVLFLGGSGAADAIIGLTSPAGSSIEFGGPNPNTDVADGAASGTGYWVARSVSGQSIASAVSTGVDLIARLSGLVVNGANAGNLQLQFAQAVSNATPTVVRAKSLLRGIKL